MPFTDIGPFAAFPTTKNDAFMLLSGPGGLIPMYGVFLMIPVSSFGRGSDLPPAAGCFVLRPSTDERQLELNWPDQNVWKTIREGSLACVDTRIEAG